MGQRLGQWLSDEMFSLHIFCLARNNKLCQCTKWINLLEYNLKFLFHCICKFECFTGFGHKYKVAVLTCSCLCLFFNTFITSFYVGEIYKTLNRHFPKLGTHDMLVEYDDNLWAAPFCRKILITFIYLFLLFFSLF